MQLKITSVVESLWIS